MTINKITCPDCGGELQKNPKRVKWEYEGVSGDSLEFNPKNIRCKNCETEWCF